MNKLLPLFLVMTLSGCFFDDNNKSPNTNDTNTNSSNDANGGKTDEPNDGQDNNGDDDNNSNDDNGNNDAGNNNDEDDKLNIVGIWDKTRNLGNLGIDEYFVAIDAEGKVTTYDYDGDSYDRGYDCYYSEPSFLQLVEQSEDTYQFKYAYTDDTLQVQLTLDDDQLNFTSLEDNSELQFSQDEKGTFGAKTTGLSVAEFERKLCVDIPDYDV